MKYAFCIVRQQTSGWFYLVEILECHITSYVPKSSYLLILTITSIILNMLSLFTVFINFTYDDKYSFYFIYAHF